MSAAAMVSVLPLRTIAFRRALLAIWLCGLSGWAAAQPTGGAAAPADRNLTEWLARIHAAPRQHNYQGTFVMSSNAGSMVTARIWHVSDAQRQVERLESLTGTPRTTLRRNDEVMTLLPEQRVARLEKRESVGHFPELLKGGGAVLPDFYSTRVVGADRVAGHDADVVQLLARDPLRFGYRLWAERRTGLILKLQTLGLEGEVLEQSAFSELQLDPPLRADKLVQMMVPPEGWRVERAEAVKTSAAAEGWTMKAAVAGFMPIHCYRRRTASGDTAVHWVFSDGLASVSLFLEPFEKQRHLQEGLLAAGATHTLTRRVHDWWLTAVGEVPPQTLRAFAQNLERRK